jgi:hypothetical protein
MRNRLADYGLRLGVVEPLLRHTTAQADEIEAVRAILAARGEFTLSDRLRAVVQALRRDHEYAFGEKA